MISGSVGESTTRLTLRIWHPDCWTLRSTAAVDAGLIAHGVYEIDDQVSARLTAYGDTNEQITDLVSEVRDSPLTNNVRVVNQSFDPNAERGTAGNATEELFVQYESKNSIHDAFISRGFVPDEEIRIRGGNEFWTVITPEDRATIREQLDEIRSAMEAEVTVEEVHAQAGTDANGSNRSQLSERQREIFRLAQRRGYYSWPREVSASELAADVDITKTTLLEHLRKAESKLLGTQ